MARTMVDEYKTPKRFWANTISTACYISNRIFLRSIWYLTPFELCFGRKPSISHLMPFGCKFFVLKRDNLDKFESRSSDGRSYSVFNLETNTIVESYDVTFDETIHYPRDVFECAGEGNGGEHLSR
jgi:hypothetical protein